MATSPKSKPTTAQRSNSRHNNFAKVESEVEDRTPVTNSIFENLPSPEELAKYEKIVPGGAERLLELAEQHATHQQTTESRALEAEIKAGRVRAIIGFILAFGAGLLGGTLLLRGSELAGLILILIDAAALVGITLYRQRFPEN